MEVGRTNERHGTGHVTSGPKRGLEKNFTFLDKLLFLKRIYQGGIVKSMLESIFEIIFSWSLKNALQYSLVKCSPDKMLLPSSQDQGGGEGQEEGVVLTIFKYF